MSDAVPVHGMDDGPLAVICGGGALPFAVADAVGKRPGGVFLMDHESFDVRGRWELDRGPQELSYDLWWRLGFDTMVTSEGRLYDW